MGVMSSIFFWIVGVSCNILFIESYDYNADYYCFNTILKSGSFVLSCIFESTFYIIGCYVQLLFTFGDQNVHSMVKLLSFWDPGHIPIIKFSIILDFFFFLKLVQMFQYLLKYYFQNTDLWSWFSSQSKLDCGSWYQKVLRDLDIVRAFIHICIKAWAEHDFKISSFLSNHLCVTFQLFVMTINFRTFAFIAIHIRAFQAATLPI